MPRFDIGTVSELADALHAIDGPAELVLKAGTYDIPEPIDFSFPVTLIGAGAGLTTISSSAAGWVVRFLAGPAMVRGIHFSHRGELPANVAIAVAEFDIRDCRFSGGVAGEPPVAGVALGVIGAVRGRVMASEFFSSRAGIVLLKGSPVVVQGNRCHGNFNHGIELLEAGCTLRRNRCEKNGASGIYIADSKVTATGNETVANSANGITVTGKSDARLEENISTENAKDGIAWTGESTGEALRNRCDRNHSGISTYDSSTPSIEDNTVAENSTGIRAWAQSAPTIRKNRIAKNSHSGIEVRESATPSIEDNTSEENAKFGIALFENSRTAVKTNVCSANEATGILVDESAHAGLYANSCARNKSCGISVQGEASVSAQMNQCDDNGEYGIQVHGKATAKLQGDLCRRNQSSGLVVLKEAAVTISQVVCQENKMYGVYLGGKGESECLETSADINGSDGFNVTGERRVRFEKCAARMNRGSGFMLRQALQVVVECRSEDNQKWGIGAYTPARLERNQVRGNKDTGISVGEPCEYTITQNESSGNGRNGIQFSGESFGEARANRCENNGSNGIMVCEKSKARVTGNRCKENQGCGILASGTASPIIAANECQGNQLVGISTTDDAAGSIGTNVVTGNFGGGIYLTGRSKPLVESNSVTGNGDGIIQDKTARPKLVNNSVHDNDLPNPNEWLVNGSHEGRYFEYKQFSARMAVEIEPAALLERAARTLRRMGWNPAANVMQPDQATGGYLAVFQFSAKDVNVELEALSLVFQGAPELNLSFTDPIVPMWRQQPAEHVVARTLYGVSDDLQDLTKRRNPWTPLHGDWSSDMHFQDGAGRPFRVRKARG